jgi:ribosomal protein S18 acetylase RimI-like enzyme
MTAVIRAALPMDLPGAYRVCLLTGDSGRDGTALFRNPDLLGHVYVGAYIAGVPDLALVVADEEGIAGYCLAAADTRAFESWCEAHWWPVLREQYPLPDDDAASTPDGELVAAIHAPPHAPEAIVADYPAHLHIDLLERTRGLGFGRRLVERQLRDLRARGVAGVHLDVAADNANAIAFYGHLGFVTVHRLEASLLMGLRLA